MTSTETPKNEAAYLVSNKAAVLEVRSAPYTRPASNEITIRTHAVAINPVDHMIQSQGTTLMFPWLTYPVLLGCDVAGIVVEVGSSTATRFSVGDRVIGQCLGSDKNVVKAGGNSAQNAQSGFQKYVVLQAHMASKIPDEMSFENATVLPLGVSTAACGLFQQDQLGLDLPTNTSKAEKGRKGQVLIWGGSTSVGSNAIQLATAAGYDVITTCSPRNFEYCKSLGASQCFDYKSKTVVRDIVAAFANKTCVGALSIGGGAAEACIGVLSKVKCAPGKKFVSMASYPMPETAPQSFVMLQTAVNFVSWQVKTFIRTKLSGISWRFIFATTLAENEVGPGIYRGFLPEALEKNTYKAKPDPLIVGSGLDKVQEAFEVLKKGVSVKKIVVLID
ncbi:hypothetical protein H2198_001742 [Neophaeococcomyces mojaviensis]|uniref:Uncharacterized protein n=1 Tax=Neophaeococcomyces mojaviensis TaxID=3383035 RepID=A0ACC3AGA7_9EURO|nr:hypothetical protein H2198_001742 [Knufia sp. JES_112]